MRHIYSFIWFLLIPFVVARLFFLSRKNPAYRQRLPERFGLVSKIPGDKQLIWIHAVSVGETQAAIPLVRTLQKDYPHYQILITTVTPTGAAHVSRCFENSVEHRYLPYDLPVCIRLFIDRMQPQILLVMETELWLNLFHACQSRAIHVAVINARLSERSASRYALFQQFTNELLRPISLIACRTDADADRFKSLGASANHVKVTGNIKFDLELIESDENKVNEKRRSLFGDRPVWIAASTHEGEEEIVIQSHLTLLKTIPEALLILAPRHPDRSPDIEAIIKGYGLSFISRSSGEECARDSRIFLLDTLGELGEFYGLADLVFMGGSLVNTGGHNYLEPAAYGKAMLTGPYFFNFHEIAQQLLGVHAAQVVNNEDELSSQLTTLFNDKDRREQMGEAARQFLHSNRGSTARVMELVSPWLH